MRRGSLAKTVVFWIVILACLMLLWFLISRPANRTTNSDIQTTTNSEIQARSPISPSNSTAQPLTPAQAVAAILFNVGPLAVIILAWLFLLFKWVPGNLGKRYRNDPQMQGEFTVKITPESFSTHNTAGIDWQIKWNNFEGWVEKQNLVLLIMRSQVHFTLNAADLSESQRAELRSILSIALPKK